MEERSDLTEEQRQKIINDMIKFEEMGGTKGTVLDNGKFRKAKHLNFKPIKTVTASELDEMDIPPIEWLVDKILPVGLAMLGAPSKYYKSYMALDLCIRICNGSKFLGFNCTKHACLYLDLESTKRRPRSRLNQILGDQRKPDNLYIITGDDEPGRINDGLEEQINYQLSEHPEIKFIVIDVFQMVRQQAKRNQSGYDRDYEDFKVLKKIADSNNVGLMLIHHTRKMVDPTDPFNNLSGSVGVMGALDCAMVISKDKRNDKEATLHITGRDMESMELKIQFNRKTFQWECIGTAEDVEKQREVDEYNNSPITKTIKKLLEQNGGEWSGTATDISNASKFLGCRIYDSSDKIGTFIKNNDHLFYFDSIEYSYKRGSSGRKHCFKVSLVS